jgi:hypothetical protein
MSKAKTKNARLRCDNNPQITQIRQIANERVDML